MPASSGGQDSCPHGVSCNGHMHRLLDHKAHFGVQCVRQYEDFTCWGSCPNTTYLTLGCVFLNSVAFISMQKSSFFSRILSPVDLCESDYILIRNAERVIEVIMEEMAKWIRKKSGPFLRRGHHFSVFNQVPGEAAKSIRQFPQKRHSLCWNGNHDSWKTFPQCSSEWISANNLTKQFHLSCLGSIFNQCQVGRQAHVVCSLTSL